MSAWYADSTAWCQLMCVSTLATQLALRILLHYHKHFRADPQLAQRVGANAMVVSALSALERSRRRTIAAVRCGRAALHAASARSL